MYISALARNAGIPHATAYGFRKNAAEDVRTLFSPLLNQILILHFPQHFMMQGKYAANLALHHVHNDRVANHYIQGTNSLAPVETRLGTLPIPNETYEVRPIFSQSRDIIRVLLYADDQANSNSHLRSCHCLPPS